MLVWDTQREKQNKIKINRVISAKKFYDSEVHSLMVNAVRFVSFKVRKCNRLKVHELYSLKLWFILGSF